ncbi:hypothetical protein H072_3416 [Dactylellina haptotyla CBS 200.50]|uniref:Uncharacterized protein n=1 Tax=Dactylellina haptotyla (strain CBS 200.50) TaxID=1284197 RepID=S8AHX2_DACHA|nr:hypothetical protein H072_3416 [Dactylellina haptotyla CBS 200.50]
MGDDEDELGMYRSMLSLLLSAQAQPKGVLSGNWVRDQAKGTTRSGAIVSSTAAPSLLTDLETKRYILKHHKLGFGPNGKTIEGPGARITEAIGLVIGQGDMDLLNLLFDGVDSKFLELKCHSTGLTNSTGPLLYAVQLNRLEMVSFLLDRGANLYVADKNKENVMNRAIFYSNCDMVELLIKAGYPPNGTPSTSNKIDISPPLHYVSTLVDAGADVNMRNGSELLDKGADIHAKDRDGNTVLHYASRWRLTLEEIMVLLDYGADLQASGLSSQIPQKYADRKTRGILAPPPPSIVIATSSSTL